MAKPSKPKPIPLKKVRDPDRARRVALHAALAVVFLGACGAGFYYVKRYVDRRVLYTNELPAIVLVNRPPWMSDHLAQRIANSVRPPVPASAMDHQMLVDVTEILRKDPWIQQVRQVRRAYGKRPGDTLQIDCDYYVPIAVVKWQDLYYLVDNAGVLLPESYTAKQLPLVVYGRERHVNIRIITGVRCPKPPAAGQKWNGDDLIAGLELAKYLSSHLDGEPCLDELEQIDVANFQGRVDRDAAQLVLVTRHGTQVRWGRPTIAADLNIEALPEQKLQRLRLVYRQYRRVDAGFPWIDLRFDRVLSPAPPEPAHADIRH